MDAHLPDVKYQPVANVLPDQSPTWPWGGGRTRIPHEVVLWGDLVLADHSLPLTRRPKKHWLLWRYRTRAAGLLGATGDLATVA
ncbi:hypothetical protein [Planctopirus hydrillae]|uniref:Uncharacterized protein n=1 Tax=Planctopirus hydrillae TaxID=1841610 RepID=A0A1C3EIR3_9PLAN|nr:hypothetical protein [Planctopirus hydrillae]ODA33131.1 hypothetical protein A6X21_05035 [Planctopirus hydrillae]